jgi:hypothetical protein
MGLRVLDLVLVDVEQGSDHAQGGPWRAGEGCAGMAVTAALLAGRATYNVRNAGAERGRRAGLFGVPVA